ncbi:phage tail protein (plasmid) [Azospirillum sp. HJ39]|uniref:phage tail protein n=1 Tax=Azospirillum sp. HJ39 TaxID=3159496 RepID=UPI0035586D8E
MKKLQSLRDHLMATLKVEGEALLTFAEKGKVTSFQGAGHQNRDFQVSYTAHLVLTDFTADPLTVFFVMVEWLKRECPAAPADALRFHVDVIDSTKVDVSLLVELVETVSVRADPAGTWIGADTDADVLETPLFPLAL